MTRPFATGLPGGHSEWEPPDPFSNSEVKTLCADASVDFVDVKVGHCQALNLMENENPRWRELAGVFSLVRGNHRRGTCHHGRAGAVGDLYRLAAREQAARAYRERKRPVWAAWPVNL